MEFQTRDEKLPAQLERVKSAIEEDLLKDERVLAVFYGGSIGEGNTDRYSDIDLRVVVGAEEIQEFIAEKRKRPHLWGNVSFFEDANPVSSYVVTHYENFIKVDSFYYQPADLKPSVWLQHITIVKDANGLMAQIQQVSQTLSYEPSFAEVEGWRTKFFAYLHETYRRTKRQEYYYALRCLDNMRLSVAGAWYMYRGKKPNAFGDWAHYEGEKSKLTTFQQAMLAGWDCSRNTADILKTAKSITAEFTAVHNSLCDKIGMEKEEERMHRIFNRVFSEVH
ncbi:nucleotidyltransferase domain-containing protein [Planococcus lenghuensis]|uniref:Nucleotidyltransferase domain-containing protein n=1 Tax=Planococcus lenghuensis TaxID=2213202 RepID=A0A1Q2KWJ5_9BACL|nr:nucleotidyltransferase domain-containing protein [Planococcus lenghuensis]AQQ52177.1 hypothetical protein B0X71_02980 [Planococcus lenghuensis]